MRLRTPAFCLALVALPVLGLPAAASATRELPSITRVTPMRLEVGAELIIRGRRFKSRRSRNTVIFQASNGRSLFVKPRRASRSKLVVVVPAALARLAGSAHKTTRFRLRVLAGRFSRRTPRRLSPVLVTRDGGLGSTTPSK
jgi:hypothetical protein